MRTLPDSWATLADADHPPEVRRLLTALVEALGGRRPAGQLVGLLGGPAVARVRKEVATGPVRLGRVRVCRVSPGVGEVAGSVFLGGRVRGLAARMELRDGRWTCTRFHLLP